MDTAETLPPTSYKFTFSPSKVVQPCPLSITSQQSCLTFLQICNSRFCKHSHGDGRGWGVSATLFLQAEENQSLCHGSMHPKARTQSAGAVSGDLLVTALPAPKPWESIGFGSRLPLDPLPMTRGCLRSRDPFPKICSLAQMLRGIRDPSRRGWEGEKKIKAQSYLSPLSLLQVSRIANEFHTRVS